LSPAGIWAFSGPNDGMMPLRRFDGGQTFDPPIRVATRMDE
jgi:hypothetical protein